MELLPQFKTDPASVNQALAYLLPKVDGIAVTGDWMDTCDAIYDATRNAAVTFDVDQGALEDALQASGYWRQRETLGICSRLIASP